MIKIKIIFGQFLIHFLNGVLSALYCIMKLFPTESKKIVFCSRQSNEPPLDFVMLKNTMQEKNREAKFVMICSRLDKSVMGCISFFAQTIRSMYHLATGSICVLDSYWPAVSMCAWYKEI